MKHRHDPDLGTQMLWVGSNPDHRVSARAHQEIVDLALVLVRDVSDRLWQGEDQVEISHRQLLGLPRGQPCFGRARLALRAVPVPTGIVGDVLMRAVFTSRNMAAERRGTAALDGAHHLQLVEADMAYIGQAPRRTVGAEDIRNLQLCLCQRAL